MATIKGVRRRWQAFNVVQAGREAFAEQLTDEYSEANKRQLHEGFDKNQQRLSRYRNAQYAQFKNFLNPLPGEGNPDFEVTGEFTNSRKISLRGDVIITEYTDEKADILLQRDPGITGLGGDFKREFVQFDLRPAFRRKVRQKTGL